MTHVRNSKDSKLVFNLLTYYAANLIRFYSFFILHEHWDC